MRMIIVGGIIIAEKMLYVTDGDSHCRRLRSGFRGGIAFGGMAGIGELILFAFFTFRYGRLS